MAQDQNGEVAETEIQPEDNLDFDQSLCNDLQKILNQKDVDSGANTARGQDSSQTKLLKHNNLASQR